MQWYVLRVAANKEVQVKDALVQKVEREALTDIIGRIEVPVERIKRIRGNKQTVHKRKLYPGYVFMEMESTDDGRVPEKAWFMIKGTSGVGDFIGSEGIPSPMRDTDVAKMLLEAEKPEEAPSIKVVESIDSERGIIKVIVTIFGRSTPLDIEYWQIEKL
jgi:transcriptional antiterminator NusG